MTSYDVFTAGCVQFDDLSLFKEKRQPLDDETGSGGEGRVARTTPSVRLGSGVVKISSVGRLLQKRRPSVVSDSPVTQWEAFSRPTCEVRAGAVKAECVEATVV